MPDHAKRGTELVIHELLLKLSARAESTAKVYAGRPDEFGLTRHIEFANEIGDLANEVHEVMSAYVAARRMEGKK
jgi:hypothetical protein